MPSSKREYFTVRIFDIQIGSNSFLKETNNDGLAVFATAHRYISLPYGDFLNLITYFLKLPRMKYVNNLI